MTVISAMRFNPQEGAIVADEQSSYGGRKLSFAKKLHLVSNGNFAIFGGTGFADYLFDVSEKVRIYLEKKQLGTTEEIANLVAKIMDMRKQAIVSGEIESKFGVNSAEYFSGQKMFEGGQSVPIRPELMAEIHGYRMQFENEIAKNGFLILGKDNEGVQIYKSGASNTVPTLVARPYDAIGSGNDSSDERLVEYLEKVKRDELENVDPIWGLEALIYGTHRASLRNQGVGGTPVIYIIGNEGPFLVSEERSELADKVVRGYRRDFLDKNVVEGLIRDSIYNSEREVDDIEDEMYEAPSDKREFRKYLSQKRS